MHGAIDLFYFLGSFEQGLRYEDLQNIWPSDLLEESLVIFERLGLLIRNTGRKRLNRFLINFVRKSGYEQLNPMLMQLLCKFYSDGVLSNLLDKCQPLSRASMDEAQKQVQISLPRNVTGLKKTKSYVLNLIKIRSEDP